MGRSGAFICIHAQQDRMKTEGVIDVFHYIKSTRIQRAGLVADLVSEAVLSSVFLYWYNSCIHIV